MKNTTLSRGDGTRDFIRTLSGELAMPGRCLALHPVIAKLERGDLSLTQIVGLMSQIYRQTTEVVRWLGYVYAKCPILAVRREIFNNLVEEELGGFSNTDAHYNLAMRVALAAGARRDAVEQAELMPETRALIAYGEDCYANEPNWVRCLGAAFGFETQSPMAFGKIGNALRDAYGMSAEEVAFFEVHVDVDEHHGDAIIDLFEHYAVNPGDHAVIRERALHFAELYWGMLGTFEHYL